MSPPFATTATGQPDILAELHDFFEWKPPVLELAPTASQSKASRKPSFYDKLLGEDFILHYVKHLPSLARDIADTADNALQFIKDRDIELPPAARQFPTAEKRMSSGVSRRMRNEGSVAEFYGRTTGTWCATVASMLELHPRMPIWASILTWTTSPSTSGYAIADGSIHIKDVSDHEFDKYPKQAWDSLEPNVRESLLRVKEVFPDLATWEIESLTVGDEGVMNGVLSEARTDIKFRWERFSGAEAAKKRRQLKTPSMGPDATNTPWTLEQSSTSTSFRSSGQAQGAVGLAEHSTSTTQEAKQRDCNDDDETYKDSKEPTAEKLLQQVGSISWLQLTFR